MLGECQAGSWNHPPIETGIFTDPRVNKLPIGYVWCCPKTSEKTTSRARSAMGKTPHVESLDIDQSLSLHWRKGTEDKVQTLGF